MSDFGGEIAYWVPLVVIVWGLMWYMTRRRGAIGNDVAFSVDKISTWPITLVLTNAVVLGLLFAGINAFVESSWGRVVGVGLAAGIVVGLLPRLWAPFVRPAPPSSQQGDSSARGDE